MKKTFLVFFTVLFLQATIFAGGSDSPGFTCVDGGSDSPGVISCEPEGGETGHGNRMATGENSTLTYIKTFIAEYNPLVYFLN